MEFELLRLWRLYRDQGTGPGHLPEPGGTMDQAAWVVDAFELMDAAAARIKAARGRRGES